MRLLFKEDTIRNSNLLAKEGFLCPREPCDKTYIILKYLNNKFNKKSIYEY